MSTVRLLVSNPAAVRVETGAADWVVAGTRPAAAAELIDPTLPFRAIVEEVKSLGQEYSLVRVGPAAVRAYRGITSSYDVFYCRRPAEEGLVVGDHFRDVLSELPVSARSVPPSVATDQLLFGTRPNDTYVEEVDQLGHGELLEWLPGETPRTELVETLSADETLDTDEAKRRLDRYFRDVIDADRLDDPVATMLSGGVDSTLLHTYADTDAVVSAAVDSPEFAFEVEYAETASQLLGADHEILQFGESEFLERVEETIDATGHPLLHPQATLMFAAMAETPYRTYLNGSLADGLFGTGTAALAHLARFLGRGCHLLPDVTREVTALKETADRLQRPVTDPEGAAMNFQIHSDEERVAAVTGREAIEERKRERLRYTGRRVDVDEGTGYEAHMHLGHTLEYFHDTIVSIWGHAAHARGKSMRTPFAGREVFETVLSVPPAERYARFALPPRDQPARCVQNKYLLKELLKARLPEYDTKKRKGHSFLPLGRYFDDGPLSDAFDRYAMPEFVPPESRNLIREEGGRVSWYALAYAIWRDRILERDLDRFETTDVIERSVSNRRSARSADPGATARSDRGA